MRLIITLVVGRRQIGQRRVITTWTKGGCWAGIVATMVLSVTMTTDAETLYLLRSLDPEKSIGTSMDECITETLEASLDRARNERLLHLASNKGLGDRVSLC